MKVAYNLAETNLLKSTLLAPETFNEKVRFKMAYDRNPQLTMFADKYRVRKFVKNRVGSDYLVPLYHSGRKGQDIFNLRVDREYVIKANHGCGGIIIVSESVETENELIHTDGVDWRILQVKPDNLSIDIVVEIIDKWMSQNYSIHHADFVEWAYRDIKPGFLVEEMLEDVNGGVPIDYKFFVFNGKCQMIEVHTDRFRNHGKGFYSLDWIRLEMTQNNRATSELVPKPQELQKMIDLAEVLAEGVDFLRVDLYLTKNGIKFGELTNYPAAGTIKFFPEFWNFEIGRDWIPKYQFD